MRKPPIILVIILAMTGLAYAFAPVLAPVPPSAVTGSACIPAAGSAPGTAVHGSISDDVGLIVDAINDMAYEAYIVNSAYLRIAQTAADAIEAKLTESEPSGLIGFKTWISVKWKDLKDYLLDPANLNKYPALKAELQPLYVPPASVPVPAGTSFPLPAGGYATALAPGQYLGQYLPADYSTLKACPINPTKPGHYKFGDTSWYQYGETAAEAYYAAKGTAMPSNLWIQSRCAGKSSNTNAALHQEWRYYSTMTPVPAALPDEGPGVWNPAIDQVLNEDDNARSPAIKGDICEVIKDRPDLVNPIIDKLTTSDLASYATDNATALQGTIIEELTAKVAADPTDIASQNALNEALAQAAAQQAQELQKEAVVAASLPDVIAEERRQIDWSPLSQLIGQGCAKVDKNDCPFPFDFIYSLGHTFDQFQSEHPSMVDPSGSYGFDNFKVDFNFDFSRFTETMAKIRLLLSWVMTIYTIHKCVRIVTRDNAAGGDDD